jgi:hypothetical protein
MKKLNFGIEVEVPSPPDTGGGSHYLRQLMAHRQLSRDCETQLKKPIYNLRVSIKS